MRSTLATLAVPLSLLARGSVGCLCRGGSGRLARLKPRYLMPRNESVLKDRAAVYDTTQPPFGLAREFACWESSTMFELFS
jgi:hypothetical protein